MVEIYEEPLTTEERVRLRECEMNVEAGIASFYAVGNALREIRDDKLYREEYQSFEDYCKGRWKQIGKSRAYQLIAASETYERVACEDGQELSTLVDTTEFAIRPIARIPEEFQKEAWEKAKALSGGSPTAKITKAVAEEYKPKREEFDKHNPEDVKVVGKGIQIASEAINILKSIPLNDPLRERGFQEVIKWINQAKKVSPNGSTTPVKD